MLTWCRWLIQHVYYWKHLCQNYKQNLRNRGSHTNLWINKIDCWKIWCSWQNRWRNKLTFRTQKYTVNNPCVLPVERSVRNKHGSINQYGIRHHKFHVQKEEKESNLIYRAYLCLLRSVHLIFVEHVWHWNTDHNNINTGRDTAQNIHIYYSFSSGIIHLEVSSNNTS